jgi:hypothetical protein
MSATIRQTNYGLYQDLVKDLRYAVVAKNGSLIPAVDSQMFQMIHPDLPDKLYEAAAFSASDATSHFEDGYWRFSHQDWGENLPQWTAEQEGKTVVFSQETRPLESLSIEDHRFQQFQELDVAKFLGVAKKSGSATKEVDDIGAMRIIVDECFQHVYFTSNHYREIMVDKHRDFVNPYIFVMFSKTCGFNLCAAPLDQFGVNNIDFQTNSAFGAKKVANFKLGNVAAQVQILRPRLVKRYRRDSYTFVRMTEGVGQGATDIITKMSYAPGKSE